ncbi:MAG: hypothetical protein KGL35_24215, partial [Bradyrhizobium sp.]|nr:hypothetical protein [Bradyrhizobium sp.]
MPSQGPLVVATGTDGGEDAAGIWNNPSAAGSTSSASFTTAVAGTSATKQTNTLKAQFSAGQFTLPTTGYIATSISITFQARVQSSGTPVASVSSVKTSLTATDASDGASLTTSFAGYTYSIGGSISPAAVNAGFEIDLRFTSPGGPSSGNVDVYDVTATVTYTLVDLTVGGGLGIDSTALPPRRPHFQPPPIESIDPHALLLANAPELIHPENLVPMYVPPRPRPHSRTYLSPIAGAYDPTMLTLANAPEPIHPENYPMEFVQRAPNPVRQAWQQKMMTEGDPTVYLLPAEPEPLHPENYPPMTLLPNPRPQREAWQFPIMASTDYTGLLSGEAAHPETTRQAGQDLPRRDFPRQYQPPMERIDPAVLSSREEPKADWLPGISHPVRQFRQVRQPAMEATSYVWATPGDPALYPDRMAMQTPQRAFVRERRPMAGESVVLDAWSGQQLFVQPMWEPRPIGPRVQSPHVQAGQTPPQYFQEAQIIAWAVPLSQPVLPLAHGRTPPMQGELAGETVQLTLAIPSDWQAGVPDVLNARPRARVAAGEDVVLQQTAATIPQGWESPAPDAGRASPRQLPAIEARNASEFATSHDRLLVEPMGLPVRQLPRLETSPTLAGVETTPQVVPPSYAFLDYDPNLAHPVKQRPSTLKLPVEAVALDTISLSLPMSEHPPLSHPVLPLAKVRTPPMQAELAGETVQLALAIPSDWQPNIPDVLNARPRARVAAGEDVVLQQTAATIPQGWESPAPDAGRASPRQLPA